MIGFFDINKLGSIKDLSSYRELSSQQLADAIFKRQKYLILNNVKKDSIVVLLNNNTIDFFIDFFALLNINAVPFPINASIKNWEQVFNSVGVSFYITEKNILCVYKLDVRISVPAGCMFVLLSSGTNGRAKAVYITESILRDRIVAIQKMLSTDIDVGLCFLSTSFGHGLIANCLSILTQSKRLVIVKNLELPLMVKLNQVIVSEGVNYISTVPAHFELFRKIGLKKFKIEKNNFELHCASAPIKEKTYYYMRQLLGDMKIKYHYGMTETGSWITQTELPLEVNKFEYGLVGPSYNLDLSCEDSEVIIKSQIFDIETIDIQAKVSSLTKKGLNFNTGDLGYIKNNNLFLSGRSSDFINKGGYKISPFDIENAILKHQNIDDCIVFSVEDLIYGEQVAALIAIKIIGESKELEIKKYCFENLSNMHFPKYFYFTSNIISNINGKISRKELSLRYSKKILENK